MYHLGFWGEINKIFLNNFLPSHTLRRESVKEEEVVVVLPKHNQAATENWKEYSIYLKTVKLSSLSLKVKIKKHLTTHGLRTLITSIVVLFKVHSSSTTYLEKTSPLYHITWLPEGFPAKNVSNVYTFLKHNEHEVIHKPKGILLGPARPCHPAEVFLVRSTVRGLTF